MPPPPLLLSCARSTSCDRRASCFLIEVRVQLNLQRFWGFSRKPHLSMSISPVRVASSAVQLRCFGPSLLLRSFLVPADFASGYLCFRIPIWDTLLYSVIVDFPLDNLIWFPWRWHPNLLTIDERDFLFYRFFFLSCTSTGRPIKMTLVSNCAGCLQHTLYLISISIVFPQTCKRAAYHFIKSISICISLHNLCCQSGVSTRITDLSLYISRIKLQLTLIMSNLTCMYSNKMWWFLNITIPEHAAAPIFLIFNSLTV